MKIVHLVTSLDFGGLERRMEILSLYPSGQSEIIFCALGAGGATYEKMISHGSNVHLLNCDSKIFRFETFTQLRSFLRKQKPNVLHTHGAEANFYGHLASIGLGIKIRVAEEIGIPRYGHLSKFIFTQILKIPDAMIAMSPIVKDFLANQSVVKKEKIHLVYNPVLLSQYIKTKRDDNKIKFIFIGRLEEIKNPLGLLRAFNLLLKEYKHTELIFVGEGSLRKQIETYIESQSIQDFVSCMGFSADPLAIARECDVVVQPSHSEGFSLALVEAMSCGLPAIVTPVGSAKVLIKKDTNGWVVDSSTDEAILSGLRMAVEAKDRLFEMGKDAADCVNQNHNPKLYAGKLDDFYKSLEVL